MSRQGSHFHCFVLHATLIEFEGLLVLLQHASNKHLKRQELPDISLSICEGTSRIAGRRGRANHEGSAGY